MQTADTPLHPLSAFQKGMLMLATIAMGAGMSINFVVVAPLTRKAGLDELQVAAILTLSTLLYAFAIPRWGRIADRVGRKRVMVFSLIMMGVTNTAFLFTLEAALAGVITGVALLLTLVFVRLWFGLLTPGLQPASMAAMTDATTPANRAAGLGMLGAGMSIGSILGPAGAAVLAPFGALAPLWGTIVFCIATGIVLGYTLPKTVPRDRSMPRPKPLAMLDARVRPHLVFLISYFVCVGMIQQTLGWFIEDRYDLAALGDKAGETAVLYTGIAFACMAAATILIQFGYLSRMKPDPRRVLPVGLGLVVVGYIGADTLHAFPLLCASFCRRCGLRACDSLRQCAGQPVGWPRGTGRRRCADVGRTACGFHLRPADRGGPLPHRPCPAPDRFRRADDRPDGLCAIRHRAPPARHGLTRHSSSGGAFLKAMIAPGKVKERRISPPKMAFQCAPVVGRQRCSLSFAAMSVVSMM